MGRRFPLAGQSRGLFLLTVTSRVLGLVWIAGLAKNLGLANEGRLLGWILLGSLAALIGTGGLGPAVSRVAGQGGPLDRLLALRLVTTVAGVSTVIIFAFGTGNAPWSLLLNVFAGGFGALGGFYSDVANGDGHPEVGAFGDLSYSVVTTAGAWFAPLANLEAQSLVILGASVLRAGQVLIMVRRRRPRLRPLPHLREAPRALKENIGFVRTTLWSEVAQRSHYYLALAFLSPASLTIYLTVGRVVEGAGLLIGVHAALLTGKLSSQEDAAQNRSVEEALRQIAGPASGIAGFLSLSAVAAAVIAPQSYKPWLLALAILTCVFPLRWINTPLGLRLLLSGRQNVAAQLNLIEALVFPVIYLGGVLTAGLYGLTLSVVVAEALNGVLFGRATLEKPCLSRIMRTEIWLVAGALLIVAYIVLTSPDPFL